MGHSTAGSLEMKTHKRINNDKSSRAIAPGEKRSFYACVNIEPNLITCPDCNKKKSVFVGYAFGTVFSCNLNSY